MFDDTQSQRRELPHLATFIQHDRRILAEGCVAARTDCWAMFDHGIGGRHQPQRRAVVPQLSTRLLAAATPQTARLAPQPVARRRFAAVVTVLGQARFQVLHARKQPRDLLEQPGVLGFQLGISFFQRHASMLHLFRKSV